MEVKKAEDAVARCQYIVAAIEELIKDRPEGGPVTDKIEYDKINDKFIIVPLWTKREKITPPIWLYY